MVRSSIGPHTKHKVKMNGNGKSAKLNTVLMELQHERLGATVGNQLQLGAEEKFQYDPYENKSQNADTLPILDEEPEVTPELGGQYLNAEILFPRWDKTARG